MRLGGEYNKFRYEVELQERTIIPWPGRYCEVQILSASGTQQCITHTHFVHNNMVRFAVLRQRKRARFF